MIFEQKLASEGLNIRGYHFKWKKAQEIVTSENNRIYSDQRHLLPYWERVRLMFLELGGEFINQKYGESH